MEVSSTTSRSQSSGFSSPRLKPPPLGSTSSSRWMVLASSPVASVMRLAARPVGAHSRMLMPFAARMRRIALTMVVLPTPGPPVMTSTFDVSASRIAATWLSASARPMRLLDPGQRLVRIDRRARAACRSPGAVSRSAMARSARCRPARKTQGVSPTVSAITAPSCSSRSSAVLDQLLRDLEQLLGQRRQLLGRQAAMALVHGLGQRVGDPGAHPDHRGLLDAELHGDRVGGLEADAADVARQPIRVLGHDLDGVGAVGLEDAHRPRRADAVAVQEDHDLAHDLLLGPGRDDALRRAPGRCRRPRAADRASPR